MTDLVSKLRTTSVLVSTDQRMAIRGLMKQAADEIERLHGELKRVEISHDEVNKMHDALAAEIERLRAGLREITLVYKGSEETAPFNALAAMVLIARRLLGEGE